MASLQELLERKAALEKEIEVTRRQERAHAVSQVRALMSEFGITMADLSGKGVAKTSSTAGSKVAVKYRDGTTGNTWSGRGLQPKWLKAALAKGRKIEEFAVR